MPRLLTIVTIIPLLLSAACHSNDPTPDPKRNLVSPSQPPASPQATTRPTWTSYHEAGNVQAMVFDLDGHLWTGGDGGVVKWNLATGNYTHYTVDDGLAPNPVSFIALAPDGSLWFGTRGGLPLRPLRLQSCLQIEPLVYYIGIAPFKNRTFQRS